MCLSIDFKPTDFQAPFLMSEARFPAFVAAWATGKTMTAIMKGVYLSFKYPGNKGLILRKNFSDLKDSTMSDFTKYTGMKVPVQSKTVRFPNGSEILFHHADELAGVAQNINLGWFFIEQAEEFDSEELFMLLRGRLRRDNSSRQGFIIANTNGHNWVWRVWKKNTMTMPGDEYIEAMAKESGLQEKQIREGLDPKQYQLFEAKSYDNIENLSPDFLADLARMKQESPSHYNRFVLNSWEDTDTADKVFDYQSLLGSVERDLRDYDFSAKIIACDPAEFGNDKSVIYGLEGMKVVDEEVLSKKSLMETAGHVVRMHQSLGASEIWIDDIGVGAGVRDRLRELGYNVMSAKSSARAEDPAHYVNLKAQMYMHAAQMFKEERVSIPDDTELIEDLAAVSYSLNSKGQICIEKKKDIKEKLGRSNDKGEALIYGLWGQRSARKPIRIPEKNNEQLDYDPLAKELLWVS